MKCRETGLAWEVGFYLDRYPEPFTRIAAESLDHLVALIRRREARGNVREVARDAENLGRWAVVFELLEAIMREQGPSSDARFAYIRACKHLGQWRKIASLLDETILAAAHESSDLESWIYAYSRLGLPMPKRALPLVQAEIVARGHHLQKRNFASGIITSTQEPPLFLTFPSLFLNEERREEGIVFLRDQSRVYDLSVAFPFGCAVLQWIAGEDPQPALDAVRERTSQIQIFANRKPYEALTAPIFWALLPEAHHVSAAEVLVALGAKSVFEVLAAAGNSDRMLED